MHISVRSLERRAIVMPLAVAAIALLVAAGVAMSQAPSAGAATANVNVGQGGLVFAPSSVTIAPGDTVTWTFVAGRHNVDAVDGSFESEIQTAPGTPFSHTFAAAGTFFYYCEVHATAADANDAGIAAGKMAGKVVVQAPGQGTPTATATSTAPAGTPTATATATRTATATATTTATPSVPKTGDAGLAGPGGTSAAVVLAFLGLAAATVYGARRLSRTR
jgi:plastocyanin